MMTNKERSQIIVVLVEKKRSNKWLAEQLDKTPATISKGCTNSSQPTLETLLEIARLLGVNYTEWERADALAVNND